MDGFFAQVETAAVAPIENGRWINPQPTARLSFSFVPQLTDRAYAEMFCQDLNERQDEWVDTALCDDGRVELRLRPGAGLDPKLTLRVQDIIREQVAKEWVYAPEIASRIFLCFEPVLGRTVADLDFEQDLPAKPTAMPLSLTEEERWATLGLD